MISSSFIFRSIQYFDFVKESIKRWVNYDFIASIIASFLVGGAIPAILFLLSSKSGFWNIEQYSLIFSLLWLSMAPYLIRYAYGILDRFMSELKDSHLLQSVKETQYSFYDDLRLLKSAIFGTVLLSPAFFSIPWFHGIHLFCIVSFCVFGVFLGSFGLYFMMNSVDVIVKIIKDIKTEKIGLFHYDNMGGIKFLSSFSNITTILWFSGSMVIPFTTDMLKVVTVNPLIQYSIFLFIIIIGVWAFLYPQLLIRTKSVEIKSHLLNDANAIVETRFFQDKEKILQISSDQREQIAFYNEQYVKRIENLKVWPFDISGIFGFFSSIFVPVLVAVITYFLKI